MKTLLLVAHDAGGALLLAHWARSMIERRDAQHHIQFKFALSGPAVAIFTELFADLFNRIFDGSQNAPDSEPLAAQALQKEVLQKEALWQDADPSKWQRLDAVITGTGWQTQFEQRHIAVAKRMGITCAAYLDHWANYRQRFAADHDCSNSVGECTPLQLPNEIWVGDTFARRCAQQAFINERPRIRLIKNRYLVDLKKQVGDFKHQNRCENQRRDSKKTNITSLICLEPIRQPDVDYQALYQPMVSFLAQQHLASACRLAGEGNVILRLHPSMAPCGLEQLQAALTQQAIPFHISHRPLANDLAMADTVFGYQSSVLVYAMALGLPVYSFFPAHKMEPILPHSDIHYLSRVS